MDISEAKAKLSPLMTQAVHEHAPVRIARRGETDEVVLLSRRQLLEQVLSQEALAVTMTAEEGAFVATIPGLGLIGAGETVDSAMTELREAVDEHVYEFFSNLRFWEETTHMAYFRPLLRYFLMNTDERLRLLMGDEQDKELDPTGKP
jgi:prevent-host-death family protein